MAAQDLAQRLDARNAAADDHDLQRLALLHQRAQPLFDRQRVGNAATRQCVVLNARDAVRVPQRAHRDDAGVEAQFVAAGGQQPSRGGMQFGHPVLQEAVPGLFDDGRPIQPQALRCLHARQDLVDVGHPLEVRRRVDHRHGVSLRQLDGCGQAGEVAANDGDVLARLLHGILGQSSGS